MRAIFAIYSKNFSIINPRKWIFAEAQLRGHRVALQFVQRAAILRMNDAAS